jgi:predicted esterase
MTGIDGMALHEGQPLLQAGAPLGGTAGAARAAMVMVHGRGGSADDILSLAQAFGAAADGWAFVAPQAANGTWYPERFMAPMARNEPWLSSALATVGRTVAHVEAAGIPAERIVLLGFSQGACLMSEWSARHARRYGGIAALSGGLIGPDGTPRDYAGTLDATPVLLGCSDRDPHIPITRVRETATVLEGLGAQVDLRIYPNAPHTVVQDEVDAVIAMMTRIAAGRARSRPNG